MPLVLVLVQVQRRRQEVMRNMGFWGRGVDGERIGPRKKSCASQTL
jgi:hypothetical protein